jgi:hypothetical protein
MHRIDVYKTGILYGLGTSWLDVNSERYTAWHAVELVSKPARF